MFGKARCAKHLIKVIHRNAEFHSVYIIMIRKKLLTTTNFVTYFIKTKLNVTNTYGGET